MNWRGDSIALLVLSLQVLVSPEYLLMYWRRGNWIEVVDKSEERRLELRYFDFLCDR